MKLFLKFKFIGIICLLLLNGCYSISKDESPQQISIGNQQYLGSFKITAIYETVTLNSLVLQSDITIENPRIRRKGETEFFSFDDLNYVIPSGGMFVFEVFGDVLENDDRDLNFTLTDFNLTRSDGITISNTQLIYSVSIIQNIQYTDLFAPFVTFYAGTDAQSVKTADLNGDGLKDVVVTSGNELYIFIQNASGELDQPIVYKMRGSRPESVDIADLNNDGSLDIAIGLYSSGIEVFSQIGDLDFISDFYPTESSMAIVSGDFNHDGLADIAGIPWSGTQIEFRYQTPEGTLAAPIYGEVNVGGYNDLAKGDLNNDGWDDIVAMSGQSYSVPNLSVLYQEDSGMSAPIFYSLDPKQNTHGVAVGDVNGDDWKDIVVSYGGNSPSGKVGVFFSDQAGDFLPSVSYNSYDIPETIEVADINRDGREDIITLHGGWIKVGTYTQDLNGDLMTEELYNVPYATHYNRNGLAVGDVNNDGKVDLLVADYNHGLSILYAK